MRAILYLTALCVFCTALMISCDSAGEEEDYMIFTGRVTEADTTIYVSGAVITDGMNTAIVDTTDDRGFFQLRGIEKTKHTVIIEKEGYPTKEIEIEYSGTLARPLVSRKIILTQAEE